MAERPILFSGPMVRALLDGTKTQTRRAMRPQPEFFNLLSGQPDLEDHRCPYGQAGDKLWVRETFAKIDGQTQAWIETDYRATYTHGDRLGDALGFKKRWSPAIHMPRPASRITLEISGVRLEQLHMISEADAVAEGVFRKVGRSPIGDVVETCTGGDLIYVAPTQAREEYRRLWEQINGAGSWGSNPWVWVVSFSVVKP